MIMIKEFLIFLIFLHQSNALIITDAFDECLEEKGEVLSRGKVCVPKKYIEWIQFPPNKKANKKTKLSIALSNIQIIEISSNGITISMNTRIKWSDYRLTFGVAKSLLSMEDQKQVWSPRIIIGTDVMSKTKEAEEMETSYWCTSNGKWCKKSLEKTFSLHTKVKCDLDFQRFPFDNHTCNIEVSIRVSMILSKFNTKSGYYF